jgi:hypothetical protein
MKNLIIVLMLIFVSMSISQTDTLNISWNANPPEENITAYTLYKGTGGSLSQIWSGLATSRVDRNTINPGGFYCYSLTATNEFGTSGYSDTVCVGIPLVTLTLSTLKADTVIPLANIAMDPDMQPMTLTPSAVTNCIVTTDASNLYLSPAASGPASFYITAQDSAGFWDGKTILFTNTVYEATPPTEVRVKK